MTKIVFLCFFYSVIFPSGFLFGALAYSATYVTDKFLLLRSWGQLPELGDDVAKLSRQIFFPLCLVVLAAISEFYWSAFPFDDLCGRSLRLWKAHCELHHNLIFMLVARLDTDTTVNATLVGAHNLTKLDMSPETYHVTLKGDGSEKIYGFCDQDYLEHLSRLLAFFHMERTTGCLPINRY